MLICSLVSWRRRFKWEFSSRTGTKPKTCHSVWRSIRDTKWSQFHPATTTVKLRGGPPHHHLSTGLTVMVKSQTSSQKHRRSKNYPLHLHHLQQRGKTTGNHASTQGKNSCEVLKTKHHLPLYHLFLLAHGETAWFFHQNSGQLPSLIHSVTATLKTHIKALAESELPGTTWLFFFFTVQKAMFIPPRTQTQAASEEANTVAKWKLPPPCAAQWCSCLARG